MTSGALTPHTLHDEALRFEGHGCGIALTVLTALMSGSEYLIRQSSCMPYHSGGESVLIRPSSRLPSWHSSPASYSSRPTPAPTPSQAATWLHCLCVPPAAWPHAPSSPAWSSGPGLRVRACTELMWTGKMRLSAAVKGLMAMS